MTAIRCYRSGRYCTFSSCEALVSDSRVLLSDADYTLLEPADGLETIWWLARSEHLDADAVVAAVREIEHETGLGAYSAMQWLAKVLEISGYPGVSEHRLVYLKERLDRAHRRKLIPYPGFAELMKHCRTPGWVKAIVSGKGHLSRDATRACLPGFDRYGFSCDSYLWNKSANLHAYRNMAERVQPESDADFGQAVILEDDYTHASAALHDGAGMAIVLLHEGGVAQRDIRDGAVTREDLESTGLMMADNLQEAVKLLQQDD